MNGVELSEPTALGIVNTSLGAHLQVQVVSTLSTPETGQDNQKAERLDETR